MSRAAHGLRTLAPALATNMCNTYIKWAEIWERIYGCPVFVLDLPAWRGTGAGETFQHDRRYAEGQLRDLVALCERLTERAFDIDRLRGAAGPRAAPQARRPAGARLRGGAARKGGADMNAIQTRDPTDAPLRPRRPESFRFQDVVYEKRDWVARVSINRPHVYNAYPG